MGGSLEAIRPDSHIPSCVLGSTPAFSEQCQQQLLIPFLIFQGKFPIQVPDLTCSVRT